MARIRTIKPEFWSSEQVADCSPTARLLFVGMWNFCDDAGVHPASAKRLKMEIFPADSFTVEEIDGWLGELLSQGLIRRYTANGADYFAVTGWHHQKIEKPRYNYPSPIESANGRGSVADYSTTIRHRKEGGKEGGKEGKEPNRRGAADFYGAVTADFLRDTAQLVDWHTHAAEVDAIPIGLSERDLLRVIATAEHCLRDGVNNPPGMFVSIIKKQDWKTLTVADRDGASRRLKAWHTECALARKGLTNGLPDQAT